MNEEYGVKITALVSEFKKKMQGLANDVRNFGKKAEENATVDFEFKSTGYTKQIEYIKKQMQDIENQKKTAFKFNEKDLEKYNRLKNVLKDIEEDIARQKKINIEMNIPDDKSQILKNLYEDREKFTNDLKKLETTSIDTEKVEKLEVDYEILGNKLDKLTNKQKEFNGELEETNDEANGMSINLGKMFDKSISKIKRFTYYLLGARSVFSLFMKYQNIYYQYNEQMQYQSELSQNAIALSLAPAFEFLGNMVAYASIAFAKFIELLTGVNVLSKVSTKGIRDYNKSLKETQTLISGIDEITNLTNPQNLGLASQYKALEDFQKKVAEVNKWFEDNPWVGDLAKGLSDIVSYISEHWDIFKYIIGGAVLTSFLGFALKGTGVGVMTLTATLTLVGITEATLEIERLKRQAHDLSKSELEKWPDVFQAVIDRLKKTKKGSKEWDEQVALIKESMKGVAGEIVNGKLEYDEYKPVIDEIIKKLEKLGNDTFTPEIDFLMKLTGDEKDLALLRGYFETGSVEVNASDYPVEKKKTTAEELNEKLYHTQEGDSVGSQLVKGAAGIMNTVSTKISNWLGKKLGLPGFANGLDYVPYDNFSAILHKGETVVPAKYNPTIHSVGNDDTNRLLETLIVKVDSLANRPNEFNVDGEKLAKTMYPLLQDEGRNYTYNEGVIR